MNTLIKQLIIVFLLLISSNMYGQFKMVGDAGSGGFTSLGNNTYSCTITYRSDLTGNFFNGTQTQTGFKLFTSSEQMYTITGISSTSINTASVVFVSDTTITQTPLFYGIPKGEILVYDASEIIGVLQAPFGAGLMAVGQNRVEVFTSQVLELGDILYAEVTQAGDNVTDLLITLTIK